MSFFSNLFGKVKVYFSSGLAVKKLKESLEVFGLTDLHLDTLLEEIASINPAELEGHEKGTLVADFIKAQHKEATQTGNGLQWPDQALKFISQIITIAYLIAKLTKRI